MNSKISYTENTLRHGRPDPGAQKLARGLGWFSIALGLVEIVATRTLTRALGMRGNEPLINLYGWREIGTGLGILASKDPTPWIWGRVLGDAVDLGTLASHATDENRKAENVAMALANVAAVTALDLYCAARLSREERVSLNAIPRDYRNRRGFPRPASEMRGAASDFEVPRDFRTPELLRPYTAAR